MKRLEDKVVIVTGATGGIGEAAVKLFIEEGANVLMVDLKEEDLISFSDKIDSNKLSYFEGDVSCLSDNQKAVDELKWLPKHDINDMCKSSWNWQKNNPNGYKK